jgi:hypothetical protein
LATVVRSHVHPPENRLVSKLRTHLPSHAHGSGQLGRNAKYSTLSSAVSRLTI